MELPRFARGKWISSSGAPEPPVLATSSRPPDLVEFLAITQQYMVDLLPITWQEGLESLGQGGSADVHQSLVSLNTSFAFKRFLPRTSSYRDDVLQYILSEIKVLRDERILSHPNIVNLVGVCWEVQDDPACIRPVLVFPKAHHGDVQAYLVDGEGKNVSFSSRLELCIDVVSAIATLHHCNVVHGDIKPQNILVFPGSNERPDAKVIDFAFSCFGACSTDRIFLPKPLPWIMAPGWHSRSFSLEAAKGADIFSCGMLCLWILFREEILTIFASHGETAEDILLDLKTQSQISTAAKTLLQEIEIERDVRSKLASFFSETFGNHSLPKKNCLELLRLLDPKRAEQQMLPAVTLTENIYVEHKHTNLSIPKSMLQLLWADFRIREAIRMHTEQRTKDTCEECVKRFAFQLATCYYTGFGVQRDEEQAKIWLSKSQKSMADLESSLSLMANGPVFQAGAFIDAWYAGTIMPADIVQAYRSQHILTRAEEYQRREIADLEASLGKHHFLACTSKGLLADILRSQDKLNEAAQLYGELIDSRQGDASSQHPSTVPAMLSLASVLGEQSRWKDSEKVLRAALNAIKSTLGTQHPMMITCLNQLSSVLGDLEQWEEAESIDREVLQRSLDHFGPAHLNTVKAMGSLAISLEQQGHLRESSDLQNEALRLSEKLLGEDHPDTLTCKSNLAQTLGAAGMWNEAKDIHQHVVERRTEVLGQRHRDTISSRSNLTTTYIYIDMVEEAEKLLVELIPLSNQVFGPEHPEQLSIRTNLVEVYRRQGQLQQAWDLSNEVLELAERILGSNRAKIMNIRASQARIMWDSGNIDHASDIYNELVCLSLEVYGPRNEKTVKHTHDLAVCLYNLEDHEGAVLLMREVVRLKTEIHGPEHPQTSNSVQVLTVWEVSAAPVGVRNS